MKSVCFGVHKGGTGKTTLSGNCSYIASKQKKVVLIDGDPQGNSSSWFITKQPNYELSDILYEKVKVQNTLVKVRENFYIIPTFGFTGALTEFSETKLVNKFYCFSDIVRELEKLNFDIAVFDISPGMKLLEKRILASCDEVIMPLSPEFFGIDGIQLFESELKKLSNDFRIQIRHRILALNKINRSFRRHVAYIDQFRKLDYDIFEIPQDSKIAESQIVNLPLSEFDKNAKSLPSIEKLTVAMIGG